jgi:hypothetical protein
MMRKKKEQDRQDQLRWQDVQDLKFYPAYPVLSDEKKGQKGPLRGLCPEDNRR